MTRFEEILARCPRVLVIGPPRAGKTTLAATGGGRHALHLDDAVGHVKWSDAPIWAAADLYPHPSWLAEGCQGYRLLRTTLREMAKLHAGEPVRNVWLTMVPHAIVHVFPEHEPEPKHEAMRRALWTIWGDCLDLLERWPNGRPEIVEATLSEFMSEAVVKSEACA